MSTDQIKIFIRRFEAMFNKPDMRIADEIFAPCFIAHFPVTPRLNRSNFKGFIDSFYDAFPDFRMEIDDTIVTNDRLVLRVIYYGTHNGDFMGIPATGCEVTMHGMTIFRIENGIAYESWTEIDLLGVVQQISSEPFVA
jgi:predicted ester cyclase